MAGDETSLETEVQGSQEGAETPSGGTEGQPAGTDPEARREESVEDRIARLEKDYQNANQKITDQGKELGQYREQERNWASERQQYQQALQALGGHIKANEDPVEAAWQQYRNATDYETRDEWLRKAMTLENPRTLNAAVQKAVQATRITGEIPHAMQMLGARNQQEAETRLAQVHQSLTPSELALIELSRMGKLDEWRDRENKSRAEEARRAEALRSLAANGGGRSVPGQGGAKQMVISFQDWASLTEEAKDRHRKAADYDVKIYDAPKHFDPNTG